MPRDDVDTMHSALPRALALVLAVSAPPALAAAALAEALLPIEQQLEVLRDANLRAGPSTDFERVGWAGAGEHLHVEGRIRGRDWYRLRLENGEEAYIYAPLLAPPAPAEGLNGAGVFRLGPDDAADGAPFAVELEGRFETTASGIAVTLERGRIALAEAAPGRRRIVDSLAFAACHAVGPSWDYDHASRRLILQATVTRNRPLELEPARFAIDTDEVPADEGWLCAIVEDQEGPLALHQGRPER